MGQPIDPDLTLKSERPCLGCELGQPTVTPPYQPEHFSAAKGAAVHSSGLLCTRTMNDEMWKLTTALMEHHAAKKKAGL